MRATRLLLLVVAADALAASPARLVNLLQPGPFAASIIPSTPPSRHFDGVGRPPRRRCRARQAAERVGAALRRAAPPTTNSCASSTPRAARSPTPRGPRRERGGEFEELGQYKPTRSARRCSSGTRGVYASLSRDDGNVCERPTGACSGPAPRRVDAPSTRLRCGRI